MVETVEPFAFWLRVCVHACVRTCKLRSFPKTSGLKPWDLLSSSQLVWFYWEETGWGLGMRKKFFLVEFWALKVPPSHPANQNCK